jgi:hypothetical protein
MHHRGTQISETSTKEKEIYPSTSNTGRKRPEKRLDSAPRIQDRRAMDPARYPVQDYPSNTGSVGVNPHGKAELEKNTNINSKKKEKLIKRKNNKKNNKNKNK